MKNLIKLGLLLAAIVYLVFAFTRFNQPNDQRTCQAVHIVITDSARASFIGKEEVTRLLEKEGLYPLGKATGDINGEAIQQYLQGSPYIADAVCYISPGGDVNISISQRLPVIRIMASNGDNYFIDNKGGVMSRQDYAANVVVATGDISKKYALHHLLPLGSHIQASTFWNDLTEQINVDAQGNIELIPRLGDQILYLGKPTDLEKKLGHLEAFYKKAMNTVGWNKYARISAEFDNQIICTKKK